MGSQNNFYLLQLQSPNKLSGNYIPKRNSWKRDTCAKNHQISYNSILHITADNLPADKHDYKGPLELHLPESVYQRYHHMILTIVEHFSVYVTCILASLRKVEYRKSTVGLTRKLTFTLLKEEMIQQLQKLYHR